MNKVWNITLNFTAQSGVSIERKVQLRDQYRSNAMARAIAGAVPPSATNITATAKAAR